MHSHTPLGADAVRKLAVAVALRDIRRAAHLLNVFFVDGVIVQHCLQGPAAELLIIKDGLPRRGPTVHALRDADLERRNECRLWRARAAGVWFVLSRESIGFKVFVHSGLTRLSLIHAV